MTQFMTELSVVLSWDTFIKWWPAYVLIALLVIALGNPTPWRPDR